VQEVQQGSSFCAQLNIQNTNINEYGPRLNRVRIPLHLPFAYMYMCVLYTCILYTCNGELNSLHQGQRLIWNETDLHWSGPATLPWLDLADRVFSTTESRTSGRSGLAALYLRNHAFYVARYVHIEAVPTVTVPDLDNSDACYDRSVKKKSKSALINERIPEAAADEHRFSAKHSM